MTGDWRDKARCSQTDPEVWFPEKGGSPDHAKRICAQCEVRPECLAYALAQPESPHGVWGGFTENERRRLRRDLGRAA
jgi:WhiB family redox-sensing transcriptional regulator